MIKRVPILLLFWLLGGQAFSQTVSIPSGSLELFNVPWGRLQAGAVRIDKRMIRQTEKYLTKLARQEEKLPKQLAKKDSLAKQSLSQESRSYYQTLQKELKSPWDRPDSVVTSYSSRLDSLQTALRFWQQQGLMDQPKKLAATLTRYKNLQSRLHQTERIRQYVQQRQQQWQSQLPASELTKPLKSLQKQAYYYQAQVSEYKKVLAQPSKPEKKLLREVRKLPAFQPFFREHSQLATLFRQPVNQLILEPGQAITGLQTVAGLQAAFTQKFGESTKVAEVLQQNIQQGTAELTRLKEKVRTAGTPEDIAVPDFEPNHQKTKTFWQRLEAGSTFQSTKSNRYFPVTTDVGLSLGYQLHDKAVIGLGTSFKVGWGPDIRHLHLTRQGVAFSSFLDYQLQRSFWLSGGAELHYRTQQSAELRALPQYQPWQKLALVGLTKKYKINARYQGKLQLLYDFLHQQQLPRTQAVLFRVGYQL